MSLVVCGISQGSCCDNAGCAWNLVENCDVFAVNGHKSIVPRSTTVDKLIEQVAVQLGRNFGAM